MKLNFIKNLSDQVVKQNYELKAQLQQAKQQLKDYEYDMLNAIATITPERSLFLTPAETLQEFIRHIRQQLTEFRQLKQHSVLLRQKVEILQKEEIEYINNINQLKVENQSQKEIFESEIAEITDKYNEKLSELEWQRSFNSKLNEEMSEIKIDKMKLEEGKRKAIEELRHNQKNMIIDFRQKNQEEHMRIEKQLKRQLQMRDKTIRQMSKSLTALTDGKGIQNSQQVLTDIFKSFQNYEELTSMNAELKQENQELREQIKQLFNRIITIQASLQEEKAIIYNLTSESQRIMMQKQEVQRQLMLKILQIAKSQKDKEAMEQYYDQKWNSEYKKVKQKLENGYKSKLNQLEKEGEAKIIAYVKNIREVCQQRDNYMDQIEELKKIIEKEQMQKLQIKNIIHSQKEKINNLIVINRENILMSAEQILIIKVTFQGIKTHLLEIIKQKEQAIKDQIQKMRLFRIEHFNQISQLHQKYEKQIKEQNQNFSHQKTALINKYIYDTSQLQKEILRQIDSANHIRSIVEKEFNIKLEEEKTIRYKAIVQKQQEIKCQNERWIDKYCELQSFLAVTRRKFEDEIGFEKKEINELLESQYNLHQEQDRLKEQIKCLQTQIKSLQIQVQDKRVTIAQMQANIITLIKDIKISKSQVDVLLANRKLWKSELLDMQRQFMRDLDSLKKISQRQISQYQDKIRELEDINRQKTITKRQIQKLNNIKTERQSLKSQIHVKQAENIILHQVKDYYQTRLRQSQSQIGKNQFKNTHTILTRRPKKNRLCNNEIASHRVIQSNEPIFQKRRYAINSAQKHYNLSLSKGRLEETRVKVRVQTMTSLS